MTGKSHASRRTERGQRRRFLQPRSWSPDDIIADTLRTAVAATRVMRLLVKAGNEALAYAFKDIVSYSPSQWLAFGPRGSTVSGRQTHLPSCFAFDACSHAAWFPYPPSPSPPHYSRSIGATPGAAAGAILSDCFHNTHAHSAAADVVKASIYNVTSSAPLCTRWTIGAPPPPVRVVRLFPLGGLRTEAAGAEDESRGAGEPLLHGAALSPLELSWALVRGPHKYQGVPEAPCISTRKGRRYRRDRCS